MRTPALRGVAGLALWACVAIAAAPSGARGDADATRADGATSAPGAPGAVGGAQRTGGADRRDRSWRIVTSTPLGPDLGTGFASEAAFRRGLTALFTGDAGGAVEAFEQSIAIRPDRTSAHVMLGASLLLAGSHRALGEIPPAARAFLADFEGQARLAVNLLATLVVGLIVVLAGRLVSSILRTVPLAAHEIVEALPPSLPRGVRGAYPIILLALPLYLWRPWVWPAGLAWALLFYTLLVRRHVARTERATLAMLAILLVLSPALLVLGGLLAAPAAPRSLAFSVAHAREPLLRDYAAGELESGLRWKPDDSDVAFQLALLRREQGRANEAVALYDRIPESAATHAAARVNAANILFARGETAQALDAYRNALALRPASAPGHYDLSQALLEGFDFGGAKAHLHTAASINFDLMQSLSRASLDRKETLLVDEDLGAGDRWRWLLANRKTLLQVTPAEAVAFTAGWFLPPTRIGAAILVIALVAALLAGRRSRRSEPCATCGTPVCRACRVRLTRRSFCAACAVLARKEGPYEAIEDLKRARIRRERGASRVVALLLAVFLPGAGHVYVGRRVLGSAILMLAGASIFLLVTGGGPVGAIPRLDGELAAVAQPALFFVLLTVHLIGIAHVFAVVRRRLA